MDFQIHHLEVVDSTNTRAGRLSKQGACEGLVVRADRQTSGKGRRGRSWESAETGNLYFSLLLRPQLSSQKAPMLTLVMAYSIAKVIRTSLLPVQIKWPNDLTYAGKKLCGILTEMHLNEEKIEDIVVGVGVNVNGADFPEELQKKATSLLRQLKRRVDEDLLLERILQEFRQQYQTFQQVQDLSFLQDEYNEWLVNCKREVRILTPGQEYEGLALGINERGELLVQKADGGVEAVYAGEVSVRCASGYI